MKKIFNILLYKITIFFKNYFRKSKVIFFNNLNLLRYFFYKFKFKKTFNLSKNNQEIKKENQIFVKDRNIVFVYRSKRRNNASTIMRTFQLKEILKVEGDINSKVVDEKSLKYINNSICILNKSFLLDASAIEFENLIKQNNIVCLDYIDSKEKLFQVEYSHCLIASSIQQLNFFKKKYKNLFVHLITHHVDPRLKKDKNKLHNLKIGYFGERENGLHINELNNLVDTYFISTNNNNSNKWLEKIKQYNAHYIARKKIIPNIYKPFLKGFTAAFSSSNVLVRKDEGDALYYLSKDYPYLLDEYSLLNILEMIDFMKNTYKSKIWFQGLEIMESVEAKSSNSYIIKEFKSLIKYYNNSSIFSNF